MKVDSKSLWEKAKYYNDLSHKYSVLADAYTKVAQELEEEWN